MKINVKFVLPNVDTLTGENSFLNKTSKFLTIVVLFILQVTSVYPQNTVIIPCPASVEKAPGEFILDRQTVVKADNTTDKAVMFFKEHLQDALKCNNVLVTDNDKTLPKRNVIVLTSKGAERLPNEGYKLTIKPDQITIVGKDAGLFYGLQTLLQLFPLTNTGEARLPCLTIQDQPRFGFRGVMLDVSRHFFSVQEVKKILDLMAYYKLNTFHWHLTDDQGWRIEIKKYPKLTQAGGFRTASTLRGYRDWFDQIPYGGFYTQEEIKDVVRYAVGRYINIIPEIEMPGHSYAALQSYPEFRCELKGNPRDSALWHNVLKYPRDYINSLIYCPTEQTFKFLEDVLTEVMELFPGTYIHIGGDEADKTPWKESAFCQDMVRKLKLKDEHELQSYFIRRMEKFINSKGKIIIGWDEILDGGVAPNATIMSWRGEKGGIAAAKQKHNVIMTPNVLGLYFDYNQSESKTEGVQVGRITTLDKTYGYDPIPKSLTTEEQQYIKGVQACVWTEYIVTPAKLEYMLLPRMLALAEVGWTLLKNKNYQQFSEVRVPLHLAKLDAWGYNYRVPTVFRFVDTTLIGDKFTFDLKPTVAGGKIYFTIDGTTPRTTGFEYTTPLTFFVPANQKRELQTIVVSPSGNQSIPTMTVMYNRPPKSPVGYSPKNSGLKYKLMKGRFTTVNNLEFVQVTDTGIVKTLNPDQFKNKNSAFGLIYEGYIDINMDGTYKFTLSSSDGAQLFIDNEMVVDNDVPMIYPRAGALPLLKGYHKVKIKYYNKGGGSSIRLSMTSDGTKKDLAAEGIFFH